MEISKMCLKLSFSNFKWVFSAILSLTVLSNCVSVSSNFDTAFLPDCTKFCSHFLGYWIGNLMEIPKMCLKQSFFLSKLVLQAIFFLTVLSNCDFVSSNLTPLFYLTVPNFLVIF